MTDAPKTLDALAADIRALTGVTDDERDTRRCVSIRNAAENGRHCAECGHAFAPDEPVWRFRKIVGRFFGWCYSFAPHCEQCAADDWHHFQSPHPCAGCGRPVHLPTPTTFTWQSSRVLCCECCGHKARAATERADRAKKRGTRDCGCCRKTFTPARADAKFCSAACKQKAHRRRVTDNEGAARQRRNSRNARVAS